MIRTSPVTPILLFGATLLIAGWCGYAYWGALVGYAQNLQAALHRDLAGAMHAVEMREGAAFWSLLGLSFLYGVFHAVGPGHGKVVIATYLASHPAQLRSGLTISVLSSLAQGITAILLVAVGFWFFEVTARETRLLTDHLEVTSFGLIAALGLYLVFRAVRRVWYRRNTGDHGHADCGHDHGVGAAVIEPGGQEGWVRTCAMILSIGIRPCSGAILILILAAALDLLVSGSIAVLAMSLGTAITVATLAVVTQSARQYAEVLAERMPGHGGTWQIMGDVMAVLGGLIILLFGLSLLQAGLQPQGHPLL